MSIPQDADVSGPSGLPPLDLGPATSGPADPTGRDSLSMYRVPTPGRPKALQPVHAQVLSSLPHSIENLKEFYHCNKDAENLHPLAKIS
jgi:hypothetical protein